jgi:hypothetical protein
MREIIISRSFMRKSAPIKVGALKIPAVYNDTIKKARGIEIDRGIG